LKDDDYLFIKNLNLSALSSNTMNTVIYPTVEEVQYYNTIAIEMFRRSKHDQAKTIHPSFIENVLKR